MAVRTSPIKQAQDEITVTVRELLTDGVIHQEIMGVLREHFAKKELWIIRHNDGAWCVTQKGFKLLTSISLAACVDFALKFDPSKL